MGKKDSFFSVNNTVTHLSEEDAKQTANYVEVIKAFTRTTNQSIYVIDYEKQGFEFVSENPLFLNGHTPEEVEEMGYDFYFKYVPEQDLQLLLKINSAGFAFFERLPLNDRKKYTISYDFQLKTNEGKLILVHQKLTPIFLNDEGKIWKAVCVVSLSSQKESGNIVIHKNGYNESFRYDLSKAIWRTEEKMELTDREKEVLQYSIRGYSINEIAEKVFLSPDTVKFHRKKMFEKMDVYNISEAISYARDNNLL